jgi:excisionase family DNA binding protein
MTQFKKTISVSQAAALCGVGRTTVGYWIRSHKLHAQRVGRNYSIPVEDFLFFLKTNGQPIPDELVKEISKAPIFRSFQSCWQYWQDADYGKKCPDCIVYKNQVQACFTAKRSGHSGHAGCCGSCRYYQEIFIARMQFMHQFDTPAAVFKDWYLWGGNSLCAELCEVEPNDLIGMGIETIVHPSSLAKVIAVARNTALTDSPIPGGCRIYIKNNHQAQRKIHLWVYPLREPAGAFLLLGQSKNGRPKFEF